MIFFSAGAVVELPLSRGDVLLDELGALPGTDVPHDASHTSATDATTKRPIRRVGDGALPTEEEVRRFRFKTCEATEMPAEVTDTWLIGVVAHGEALAGMRVHGGWVAAGPASGRPVRAHVRLRYSDDGAADFPDPTTAASLLAAEEVLVDALGEQAELVAVMTVPGFRDLEFHTADGATCLEAVELLDLDDVHFPLTVDLDDDPAWSRYRALFADAVLADADRRLIVDAARASGEGAPEREIVHGFRFPSLHEADQAAAALRSSGVTVTFVESDDANAEAPPRFEAREVETLTQAEMARSRAALSEFAASWDGDYEGWQLTEP